MKKETYVIINSAVDNYKIYIDLTITEFNLLQKVFYELNDNRNRYSPSISINKTK